MNEGQCKGPVFREADAASSQENKPEQDPQGQMVEVCPLKVLSLTT